MRIYITSVFVDDQEKALRFYTDVLGFEKKHDIPMGEARWLTLVSPDAPDGTELLLEPSGHPAVPPYKTALVQDASRPPPSPWTTSGRSTTGCASSARSSPRSRWRWAASPPRCWTTPAAI